MAQLEPGSGKYPTTLRDRTGVTDEVFWPLVQDEDRHYERINEFDNIRITLSNFSETLEELQRQVEKMQRDITILERRHTHKELVASTKNQEIKRFDMGGKVSRRRK